MMNVNMIRNKEPIKVPTIVGHQGLPVTVSMGHEVAQVPREVDLLVLESNDVAHQGSPNPPNMQVECVLFSYMNGNMQGAVASNIVNFLSSCSSSDNFKSKPP